MFLIAAHATMFVNSCTCNYVGYKYSHSIVTKIINFTFFPKWDDCMIALICCHSISKLSLHPLHLQSYHISVHFWTPNIAHLLFSSKVFKIFVIMEVITLSILFFAHCTHIEGSNFTFKEINNELDQQRFISKPKTSFYRGLIVWISNIFEIL